jgi:putative hydrolase of the HAD superfamily
MKNITHVFFDLDHTLWDTDLNSEESLSELFVELGLEKRGVDSFKKFLTIYKKHNERLWGLYAENKIGKESLRLHRFQITLKDFNIQDKELATQLADEFILRTPGKKNLIAGTIPLLEHLHQRYHLAIITNGFKEAQYNKLEASEIGKYFDKVYISEEVGCHKPDPAIFHFAVKESQATSNQHCIMVGDTYHTDVVGAVSAGLHAVHYAPHSTDVHPTPVVTIRHLDELKLIL